jgi:hypothetical protein
MVTGQVLGVQVRYRYRTSYMLLEMLGTSPKEFVSSD